MYITLYIHFSKIFPFVRMEWNSTHISREVNLEFTKTLSSGLNVTILVANLKNKNVTDFMI